MHFAAVDGQVNGDLTPPLDDDGAVTGHSDGHGAPSPAVALAQVARVGGLEHGHRLGGQREKPRQGAHGQDDGVVGSEGVAPFRTAIGQEGGGHACAADAGFEQIRSFLDTVLLGGEVDVQNAGQGIVFQHGPASTSP